LGLQADWVGNSGEVDSRGDLLACLQRDRISKPLNNAINASAYFQRVDLVAFELALSADLFQFASCAATWALAD